jgi:hypothetical protein
MRTLSYQLVAFKNRDRVRMLSTMALLEGQLRVRCIETVFNPQIVIADVDEHEGLTAIKTAIAQGLVTVALTDQPISVAHYTLKRPLTAKDLLQIFSDIQHHPLSLMHVAKTPAVTRPESPKTELTQTDSQMLRNAKNLLQYLSQVKTEGIVEVRFGFARSVVFNHALKSYCSALPLSALLASAHLPIQEVAHGDSQAKAEWDLACRVLSPHPIEDLAWQVAIANAELQPKKQVLNGKLHLKRLPETSVGLSRAQRSMALALKQKILSVAELATEVGAAKNEAANFCYAAHVCQLLEIRA